VPARRTVVVVLKGSKVADMAAVATVGVERKDDHLTLAMMGYFSV
jgi:hypothetical protein